MTTAIVSHASFGSRQLARRLGIRRVVVGRRPLPPINNLINWGCTEIPGLRGGTTIFNDPRAVQVAVDKVATLRRLSDANISTIEFTTEATGANRWLEKGNTVFGRTLTKSSGGKGIELYIRERGIQRVGSAPLYTRFWKCDRELRVHVVGNEVVDFAEKRRVRTENPKPDRYWIRTHNNGWIYAREGARCTQKVKDLCIQAIRVLGLDFGAVDVRVRDGGEARILEVNTAPGITGTTVNSYAAAFRRLLRG